ncbi:hypothetical protein [Pseudosporangium ferrugineum]|uniref:Membrane protein YeaQ/YmgE (Transglycosylase-associated protein family) n=1 Tax=Pseudosporangium ferrugineum TaxID=439699 RepID=A0A2T0RG51_9ACTN|nr:hypothetical protein [Pseudosporangium ferrugineum]PRY20127.1 hypothetical protein CLV70_1258 [Pseudosporangium ferrugineum]
MTISSLATAVAVGTLLGLCGRWAVPAGRSIPFWVPLAVAVGAAVLGSVVSHVVGIRATGISPLEVVLQVMCAGVAVTLVVATADRQPPEARPYDVSGSR